MKTARASLGAIAGCVAILISSSLVGADWPQWRGPQRNGISQEKGLLKQWPSDGPKLLWRIDDAGFGYSTPAVAGDRLYILSNKGLEDEFVQARTVSDGKTVWSTRIGKVGNPNQKPPYPGARSTPTIDGDVLYALGSAGDLVCLELKTGKIQWQKNLRDAFGGQPGMWAYSESPLIDGDILVCTPGGADATLVALNKKTGDLIWKSSVPGGDQAGYASVVIVQAGGVKQYVQLLQKGLVGVNAKSGKFLWRYDKIAQGSPANIPTPVIQDDYVYSSTGMGGCALVKLKAGDGGAIEAEEVYFSPELPKAIGGAVKLGPYLYGTTGTALVCAEFTTGEIKWADRAVGPGSVCYADGQLYLHGENNGEVALVDATPDGYRIQGRFAPPEPPAADRFKSKAWAYPVVANGRLFIRDRDVLWCYDIKDPKTAAN